MKTVIRLCDTSNKGKTTSLLKVMLLLDENGWEVVDSSVDINKIRQDLAKMKKPADQTGIFSKNGVLVAIATGGDTQRIVSENVETIRRYISSTQDKLAVVILASRTSGRTYNLVAKFAKDSHYELISLAPISTGNSVLHSDLSVCTAKSILQIVDFVLQY